MASGTMAGLIDSSVVLKWFVGEDDSAAALKLHGQHWIAPDLIRLEVANALWKRALKGDMVPAQASAALTELELLVEILPSVGHQWRALEIALTMAHPVYDCVYVAMAEAMGLRLVTADRRLITACAGTPFAALVEPLQPQ
jgi:predicted nucleic acid-binding protein